MLACICVCILTHWCQFTNHFTEFKVLRWNLFSACFEQYKNC